MKRMTKQLLSLALALMFLVCLLPVGASAAEVTTIVSEAVSVASGWQQACAVNTTVWGGSIDPSFLTEGGYFTVYFTGENVWNVHLALNGAAWAQMTCEADAFAVAADGSYSATFSYDACVAAYGTSDFSGMGQIILYTNTGDGVGATVTGITYTAAEAEEEPTEAPEETEATEETEAPAPETSGTVLFSGEQTVDSAWTLGLNIDTTNNGGAFDPAEMANGGYFTVTYTGTEGALYMAVQDAATWGWYQVDAPSSTEETENGYVSTFTLDDLAAKYGGAADFSDLGKVFVGTGNSTGTTVITELAWHAAEAEPVVNNAYMYFNDADWSVGTYDVGVPLAITGAGTYTASWTPFATAEGVVTFYVNVEGGATLLKNCQLTDLKITADGVDVPVEMSKVLFYTNDDGSKTIEIYNAYNSYGTGSNPPIDVNAFTASQDITVTFTLVGAPADGTNANTGDSFQPAIILVMLVSAAALGILLSKGKKYMI